LKSEVYNKTEINNLNVSHFNNDIGYLTEHQSLDNYYTKSQTYNQSEIDLAISNVEVDLSEYYNKTEVYNKSEIDTKTEVLDYFSLGNYSVGSDLNLTNGLVSYWKFDETSGTTAVDSHGSNNGTVNNARVFTSEITGKINTGVDFTGGNDWIASNNNIGLSGSQPKSFSFWVYPTNVAINQFLIHTGGESTAGATFGLKLESKRLFFIGWGGAGRDYNTGTDLVANQWQHIIVTYNGSNVNTYVNGTPTATTNQALTLNTTNSVINIGRRPGGEYTSAYFDEIGIWNKTLNSTEITALYNSGSGLSYDDFNSYTFYDTINISQNLNIDGVVIADDFITKSKVAEYEETSITKLDNFEEWKTKDTINYEKHYANVIISNTTELKPIYENICESKFSLKNGSYDECSNYIIGYEEESVIKYGLSMETRVAEMEKMIYELWNEIKLLKKSDVEVKG